MDVRIDSVNHEVENRINIVYLKDGFEEKVVLTDREYTAYVNKNTLFFKKKLEDLEQSYRRQHSELLGFIEEYSTPGMWSEWVCDTIKEMVGELDGCSYLIGRIHVVLKAMSEGVSGEPD